MSHEGSEASLSSPKVVGGASLEGEGIVCKVYT